MRLQSPAGLAGSAVAPQVFKAACDTSDSVGDAAYTSGDTLGGLPQVRKVDVDDSAKRPGVGVIIRKLTSTTCIVQIGGIVRNVFSGLTPGKHLFISTSGQIEQAPPAVPTVGTRVVQAVGYALASDIVVIQVMVPTIRVST